MNLPEPSSARRHRSRQQLLEVIRRENGVTRADLSLITGLSRSAVAMETVQDLLNERLIAEDVLAAKGRGLDGVAPSALLVASGGTGSVVGIDFDHERVTVAVAGSDGSIRGEEHAAVNVDTVAAGGAGRGGGHGAPAAGPDRHQHVRHPLDRGRGAGTAGRAHQSHPLRVGAHRLGRPGPGRGAVQPAGPARPDR